MAAVSATLVKELREKTGAGMMDCKKALTDTDGDMEAALDILKKKGLAAAAKRAGRKASEGLVVVKADDAKGVLVEVNCETDFVARNEQFQKFALTCADIAFDKGGDFAALKAAEYPEGSEGKTVEQEVPALTGVIGEKLDLRRSAGVSLDGADGVVATYLHNPLSGNMGQIGVLVALESGGDKAKLREVGQTVAMHVSVARPESVVSKVTQTEEGEDTLALARRVSCVVVRTWAAWMPPSWRRSGRCSRIRPARAASPRRSSTKWSRADCANSTNKSSSPNRSVSRVSHMAAMPPHSHRWMGCPSASSSVCVLCWCLQEWMLDDTKRKVSKVLKDAEGDVGGPIKIRDFKIFKLGEGVEEAPAEEA